MRVYIGVGHGGSDPGAVSQGFKEKDLTLSIALALRDELRANGIGCKMSRETDKTMSINEKAADAAAWGATHLVEVHINAGGGDGFEVLYQTSPAYTVRSKDLAKKIEDQVKAIGQNSRGLKTRIDANGRDYFGMLRLPKCPSVLVEAAFIDSKDIQIIDTLAEQKKMGQAFARGVMAVANIMPLPPPKITVGSTVLVNGRLHVYNNGDQPHKTLATYKGIVTTVSDGKPCPYLISAPDGTKLGWVKADAVKLI